MRTICPASLFLCLGTLMMPRIRLRVVWGFGEIIASFSPTSAFNSVLLPALGRPRIQTNPEWNDIRIGNYTSGSCFSVLFAGGPPASQKQRQSYEARSARRAFE